MGSRRKPSLEEQLELAVASARSILETRGVVAGRQLGAVAVRPRVVQRLCSEGYEPTAKGVRVALGAQCERLLSEGEPVAVASLGKRLVGASAKELKALVDELREASRVQVVFRGKQQYLVRPDEPVLRRDGLKTLVDKLKLTTAWLEKARKDKADGGVLAADVLAELAGFSGLLGTVSSDGVSALLSNAHDASRKRHPDAPSPEPSAKSADSTRDASLQVALRGAILALRDEDSHLASIPMVSRRLRARATPKQVKDVLLSEFRGGKLELRPEGGMGRLNEEDRALCPMGAGGVPLSWVVLLEE